MRPASHHLLNFFCKKLRVHLILPAPSNSSSNSNLSSTSPPLISICPKTSSRTRLVCPSSGSRSSWRMRRGGVGNVRSGGSSKMVVPSVRTLGEQVESPVRSSFHRLVPNVFCVLTKQRFSFDGWTRREREYPRPTRPRCPARQTDGTFENALRALQSSAVDDRDASRSGRLVLLWCSFFILFVLVPESKRAWF